MKTANLALVIMSLLTAVSVVGCGRGDSRDDKASDNDEDLSTTALTTDTELTGQTVSSQIDDTINAMVDDGASMSTGSLNLVAADKSSTLVFFRACTVEGEKAKVNLSRSMSRTWSVVGAVREAESSLKVYDESERLWSREGEAIVCDDQGKHVDLAFKDLAGVTLDVTYSRQRQRDSTFKNLRSGKSGERSFKSVATGSRKIEWSDVSEDGGHLIISKTVSHEGQRQLDLKNKDGVEKSLSYSVATGSPLKMQVTRDAATFDFVSSTIETGTIVASNSDGGRIETSFDSVQYDDEKRCRAVSGKVTGAIYVKDATEASVTYVITFDGEDAQIVFGDGSAYDYTPEGCDLDEPAASSGTEAETEEAVVSPIAE